MPVATVVNVRHVNLADPDVVYIGRSIGTRRGLQNLGWGNPFVVTKEADREWAIEMYKAHVTGDPDLLLRLPELLGKRLACWCRPKRCHGDVLVELLEKMA